MDSVQQALTDRTRDMIVSANGTMNPAVKEAALSSLDMAVQANEPGLNIDDRAAANAKALLMVAITQARHITAMPAMLDAAVQKCKQTCSAAHRDLGPLSTWQLKDGIEWLARNKAFHGLALVIAMALTNYATRILSPAPAVAAQLATQTVNTASALADKTADARREMKLEIIAAVRDAIHQNAQEPK